MNKSTRRATTMGESTDMRRLVFLSIRLQKYGHRWGEEPSQRMRDWVDEYNRLKDESPVWAAYCKDRGLNPDHNAYDCMA